MSQSRKKTTTDPQRAGNSDGLRDLHDAGKQILRVYGDNSAPECGWSEGWCSWGTYLRNSPRVNIEGVTISQKCTDNGLAPIAILGKISSIDFNENKKVTDAGLAHLRAMPLKKMNLVGTKITDAGLNHLAEISTLETLNLNSTRVTSAGLKALIRLKRLRSLDLGFCKIDDAGLATLAELTSLEELSLNDTQVTSEGIKHLIAHPSLKMLDLRASRIRPEVMQHLATMPSLHEISINMGDSALIHLPSLQKLRELSVFESKVTKKGLSAIGDCSQLHRLHLVGTLDQASFSHLHRLKQLRRLYCSLTDTHDLAPLLQMPALTDLSLDLNGRAPPPRWLASLATLTDLKCLWLCLKKTSNDLFADLGRIFSLQELTVLSDSGTATDADLLHLQNLGALRVLHASASLSQAGVEALTRLSSLQNLCLGGCKFSADGLRLLSSLQDLEELTIAVSDDSGYQYLSNLPNLRRMECSSSINDQILAVLATFPRLSELKADSGGRLSDAGIARLAALVSLSYLCILNSPKVTTKGVNALCKAMPGALNVWN